MMTRRNFLTYLGLGSYEMLRSISALGAPALFPRRKVCGRAPSFFKPIAPSGYDKLILPKGFHYDIVCTWGDSLGTKSDFGPESFGADNDFTAYFPMDALSGGKNSKEGLLYVNHEYVLSLFASDYSGEGPKTREQIQKEKLAVGGSVLQVRREKQGWKQIPGSKYTRRLTALYPKIAMSGPAAERVPFGIGTLSNCSGGKTPWNTALSGEENFHEMNPSDGFGWGIYDDTRIDEQQYGWIVEIDPFGELPPHKLTALGRFAHENAAVRIGPTGKVVVYMGDDSNDQCLYKFVSAEKWNPKATRAEKRKLLEAGTLYVADFIRGKWIPLDIKRSPELEAQGFKTQADVLIETRKAAAAVKGTPLDRPEDCEIHPLDGSVYVSLTNNFKHGNYYGQIVRLIEAKDNPEGEAFRYEIFLAGGPQSGLSCPDNLLFDKKGNLWVACDITTKELNKGTYEPFLNNGLFVVPTQGAALGEAYQFASGPNECELTGPSFNENEDTLFLSVQHPGERSINRKSPTSRWPGGGNSEPRAAVVAITGF